MKEQTKHTPGEWEVDPIHPALVITKTHIPMVLANCGHDTSAVAKANAFLISEAPAMFEVLEFISKHELTDNARATIYAILARVKGGAS